MGDDHRHSGEAGLAEDLASLRERNARLQVENARLLRLLELTPGPAQTGLFDARPGPWISEPPHSTTGRRQVRTAQEGLRIQGRQNDSVGDLRVGG